MSTRWGKQKPPLGAQINWGHPLARDIKLVYFLPSPHNIVTAKPGTISGIPGSDMRGWILDGTQYLQAAETVAVSPTKSLTVIAMGSTITLPGANTRDWAIAKGAASNYEFELCFVSNLLVSNKAQFSLLQPSGVGFYRTVGGVTTIEVGRIYMVGGTWNINGTEASIFLDGKKEGSITTGAGTLAEGTAPVQIASRADATSQKHRGLLQYAAAWQRCLTVAEMEWLNAEPYAFMQPPQPWRKYFVPETVAPAGQPFAMRTATIPYLGGSLRQVRF